MYALVFPGQGSQRPGMGQPWRSTPAWSVVARLSDVTGRDIARLLTDADVDELKATRNSQLATFTLSLVILHAAREAGLGEARPPVAVAGHSLGEYSALVAAGALGHDDGARLVTQRSEAMQAAAEARPGTMAAILGLDLAEVTEACQQVSEAWVANDNAPGQVVIAGTTSGVEAASARARQLGAKRVMPLLVGGAFHSPLMAPARQLLDAALAKVTIASPAVPVVANVDAEPHLDGAGWPQLLSDQLSQPVRWRESLTKLADLGVTSFIELGPGTELSGMVKRTVVAAARANIAVPDDLAQLPAAAGMA